jgi:predicted RNA polymerase sigma factor
VLEVTYLIFNEGYAAAAGDDWMRPALCQEAMRLGRILAGLLPDEPEVVDSLLSDRALAGYPQLPAARAELLTRLGRLDEARQEFERAAKLTCNERERAVFEDRAAACVRA